MGATSPASWSPGSYGYPAAAPMVCHGHVSTVEWNLPGGLGMERVAIHRTLEGSEPGECGIFFCKIYILHWTGYGRMEPWGVSSLLSWYFPEKAARVLFFRPASPSTKGKYPSSSIHDLLVIKINTKAKMASTSSLQGFLRPNWKVGKTWRSATNKPNWKMRSTGFYWPTTSVTEWRWKGLYKGWFKTMVQRWLIILSFGSLS